MIDVSSFLVFALATWRIASFLVNEKGPFDVFLKFRSWIGIVEMQLDDKPEIYKAVPDTFLGQVFDCVWCCSVWVGIGWTALYYFIPTQAVWIAFPLAMSAIAIGIEKFARL